MAHTSKIEWTEATWNPWHGCHKVSPGCKNCYMFRDKKHYGQDPNVVVRSKTKFYDPLKWKEPRTIFTCSWSDFFIEEADPWRDEAFAIMALTPQHTYQVLTKRPERMLEYLTAKSTRFPNSTEPRPDISYHLVGAADHISKIDSIRLASEANDRMCNGGWPLPSVWLGVSVEDQKTADERIPLLLQTPAAVRWLSVEPLLGPISFITEHENTTYPLRTPGGKILPQPSQRVFRNVLFDQEYTGVGTAAECRWVGRSMIDWIVAGGESGPDARPMHPDWARSIRDQCTAAGVPFFFKQWGEYGLASLGHHRKVVEIDYNLDKDSLPRPTAVMTRMGKHKAGRLLDGREWNEMPQQAETRPVGSVSQ